MRRQLNSKHSSSQPQPETSGLAFFNLTGATASAPVRAERSLTDPNNINARPNRIGGVPNTSLRSNPNVTFGYYLFLNLTTSFTGKDALVTQLVTGNGNSPANNFASAGFTNSWEPHFLIRQVCRVPTYSISVSCSIVSLSLVTLMSRSDSFEFLSLFRWQPFY